jgi:CheY-like chemotaxis protein
MLGFASTVFENDKGIWVKILLADDEKDILVIYSALLEGNGHVVVAASNGKEVIRLLSDTDFDMLILDLYMPPMNGFEVIKTLRDAGYAMPVIVMTGHFPDEEVNARLEGLQVCASLRKPVMISTLLNAVNEAMT